MLLYKLRLNLHKLKESSTAPLTCGSCTSCIVAPMKETKKSMWGSVAHTMPRSSLKSISAEKRN